ncbi:SDR family NAD(P)-dependent oxidoreductase [Sodalis ligni]|jgi:NAD(P)-dependent dehydrogenase (short-subunit alcohol dehydrogenase family)|uniref:NAD(P)-dependent dehydrogenase (Short-subunit alcohol dehydrogenase family) n=1 Tax=Sodalis ligni TaxID=2697027 RepID=A0A4R1N953_9GAMM|nr:SDR family oxidoreductase [Sodalis ligni]TCL03149.1 NAD(P)-dependent dehydrogenase (short-subunit alcohol dehydrogenase family) [Sodalis ligni]
MSVHAYTRYRSLANKTIIITGGASGIGAAMVEAFASQESRVHFIDIDSASGKDLAAASDTTYHQCDIGDIHALRNVIQDIGSWEEGIDVLVNNAGNDDRHDMLSVEPDYWRNRLAINLDHQFFASQAVAPLMQKHRSGSIILTSSTSFMKGRPGLVGYTTAKAAIIGLNRTLARELGPDGIRVNCIVPGAITTPRQEALWLTLEAKAEIIKAQALKITLQSSDVAAMALFLASEDARGCTGAQFLVDAGIS